MNTLLRADEVTYSYPQHTGGLRPTSLALAPGEALLIAGPSGGGKSTLARVLTGLIPHLYHGALGGAVWVDGLRTSTTPLWQLAERAGLVFQNPALQMLAWTVEDEIVFGLENLGLAPAEIRARVDAALEHFDLASLRDRSPQTLSGGEQQKLALAAITARQPAVLALDEPLSMLDGPSTLALLEALARLASAGNALVICEHRIPDLETIPGLRTLTLGRAEKPGDAPPAGDYPARTAPDALQLEVAGLRVTLADREVLRDLALRLPGGQVVAIVGRNGVGKTTLVRALAGLQARTGSVSVNGERPDFGLVFQNANLQLFNASVREEILYRVPDADPGLYAWLLAALGLARYEHTPPLLLSEGEKKRVALATVLMRRPRHGVLLDEPALGQDAAHKAMLVRVAHALAAAGQIVILTTHDAGLAAQADRILLLGPDGWLADGRPADLQHDPAVLETLGPSAARALGGAA
jgi:energy-coupling factor transport system ATP-binding protein